jgi:capsular polysaccharide biosynthesis protein
MHVKPWFPDWTLPVDYDFLRAIFAPHISNQIRPGLRIYVSRNRDAQSRRVQNEEELLTCLLPMNFIPISLTDLSVKEQIQVFSQAETIVCPHGAGMSFMIFANPATKIIELNGPSKEKRHYSHIAWHLELDYYRLICKPIGEKEDMIVPIDRLERLLSL